MKKLQTLGLGLLLLCIALCVTSFSPGTFSTGKKFKFPYRKAGLTEREAAAHLLSRFSYGIKPGQVDEVIKTGLEKWFLQQLSAKLPDDSLNNRLTAYTDINLTNSQVCAQYPPGFVIRTMAIRDSVISKDSVDKAIDKKAFNDTLLAYMKRKGIKSDQDLYKQFINQHILRAVYSNNQLQEIMTDFWFNHFNVSFTKAESAQFIPAFERDVIRPNVFGNFDQLVLATAKSPAMLYFLDNFTSVGPPANPVKPVQIVNPPAMTGDAAMMQGSMMMTPVVAKPQGQTNKNIPGLNENYAREVMELHTLGVDGGYTQQDVTQAARVLTGWTIYPISDMAYGSAMKGLVDKIGVNNLPVKGYVREGDFLFTPNRHDTAAKMVLGHEFAASGGYQEGVDLLEMLAHHPSAAKFISRKIAIRFVNDNPPQSLVDKMAATFSEKNGSIAEVLLTMVSAPEFWTKQALREKTKSPVEFAISSVRALNADVKDPYQLYTWIARMGQKLYYYQAPTGFPDRSQYWINTGSLLNRMNFGLALAQQRIPGVRADLAALNDHHEPESASAALEAFSKILLPERELGHVYEQLTPLLNDPSLYDKVNNAAKSTAPKSPEPIAGAPGDMMMVSVLKDSATAKKTDAAPRKSSTSDNVIAQVVGIIIGSPEFQRR